MPIRGQDWTPIDNKLLNGEIFYSLAEVKIVIERWRRHYNTKRPHLGYRNMGRRAVETVMSFVSQEG